jgi:23S rRNA (guanine745-N1)-methyltransferase
LLAEAVRCTTVRTTPLACSVRDCGLLLVRDGRVLTCARGHSYDIARSGYINLLQPHDRRSLAAGDSHDAVAARARLERRGIGTEIADGIVNAAAIALPAGAVVADSGCGTGEALAMLATRTPIDGVGIDLSPSAVELAARAYPMLTWIVANADRRLPLLDRCVDLVMSIHGRRNAADCARVLPPSGLLLVAVPADDDLVELRAALLGRAVDRDRAVSVVAEHADWFTPLERWTVRKHRTLDREAVSDVLLSTYRGARFASARRREDLEHLDVTFASDVVLLRRR